MKRKRIFAVLMAMVMLFGTMGTAYAKEIHVTDISMMINDPMMWVDGKQMSIDDSGATPIIKGGRTLLPVRAVVEALDGRVGWDAATQSVVLQRYGNEIKMKIGSKTAYLNGEAHTLDTAPVVINGRTMLPIRFIADGFDVEVQWSSATQTISLMAFPEDFVYEPTTPVQPEDTTQPVQGNTPSGFAAPSAQNKWKTPYNLSNTWLSEVMDETGTREDVRWYMGNYRGVACCVAITMYTKSSIGDLYQTDINYEEWHYPLHANMPVFVKGITADGKYYVAGNWVWWGDYYIPVNQLTETPPANMLQPADLLSKPIGKEIYLDEWIDYYGLHSTNIVPNNYEAEYYRSIGDPKGDNKQYAMGDRVLNHYVYADTVVMERSREEILKIWKIEIDHAVKHFDSTKETWIGCKMDDFTEEEFFEMSDEFYEYMCEKYGLPEYSNPRKLGWSYYNQGLRQWHLIVDHSDFR